MATGLDASLGQQLGPGSEQGGHLQLFSFLHTAVGSRALQSTWEGGGCDYSGCCATEAGATVGSNVILYEHICKQAGPFSPILCVPCSSGIVEKEWLCLGCLNPCRVSSLLCGPGTSFTLPCPARYLWLPCWLSLLLDWLGIQTITYCCCYLKIQLPIPLKLF